MRRRALLLLALGLVACRDKTTASPAPSATASAGPDASQADLLTRILEAEQTRRATAIPAAAASSRHPEVRIASARARARIQGKHRIEDLLDALSDEDEEVLVWAAFGLGKACRDRETAIVPAIVIRAASLMANASRTELDPSRKTALEAMANALSLCDSSEAERSLRAWLGANPAIAEATAIALGKLGARRGGLEDASFVALLDAASQKQNAVDGALYAFARLSLPDGVLKTRLLQVLEEALTRSGLGRGLAIGALGRAGDAGIPRLAEILRDVDTEPAERAWAARELSQDDHASQRALGEALPALVPGDDAALSQFLLGPGAGVLFTVLEGLSTRPPRATPILERLADLQIPEPLPLRRRVVAARCKAAAVLADRSTKSPRLVACDPEPEGRQGGLALLSVLDRGSLTGPREKLFQTLLGASDPVVRRQALSLLQGHRETRGSAEALTRALSDEAPGCVAAAAEVLTQHPERAGSGIDQASTEHALRPDPKLVNALLAALSRSSQTSVELQVGLIDAAAALGLLGAKSVIAKSCEAPSETMRDHAERALRALGDKQASCPAPEAPGSVPDELGHRVKDPVELQLETDVGELSIQLEPALAPIAVTRVVDLAKAGFYNDTLIHRVIVGFAVQLGDRGGDGYGGAPAPALRSELGPWPFEPLSVGMAESGKDTASSQFFVTLGRFPHLDGEFTRIGKAAPGWDRLVVGDRVLRVRIGD